MYLQMYGQYTPQKGVKNGLFWGYSGGPDPGGPDLDLFWGHFEGPKQLEISSIRGVQHVVAHV